MSQKTDKTRNLYATPAWVINALLERHPLRRLPIVLEPCAGDGAIIQAIRARYPDEARVIAVEIREEERESLCRSADEVHIADFLTWKPTGSFDYIITNPPFSIAMEVVRHALELAGDRAEVIMLLRLAFLESEKRYSFWQEHPASRILVLSSRPSFSGDGWTDTAAVAWFVWSPWSQDQRIQVIDSPTRARKKNKGMSA